jgi:hypothetical protein
MNLKQTFGLNDSRIDWRYPLSMGIALIIPQLILISFILFIGRLVIGTNTGIFANGLLYSSMIEIICDVILVMSLVLFLNIGRIPIIVSIIIASVLSRMPDFILGNQLEFISLNILTNLLLIVLFQNFLKRFKDPFKGLIIAFLLTTITNKILVVIIYAFLFYRQFGKAFINNSMENGEMIRKFVSSISGGLTLTLLFSIGLLLSYRLIIKKKMKAL